MLIFLNKLFAFGNVLGRFLFKFGAPKTVPTIHGPESIESQQEVDLQLAKNLDVDTLNLNLSRDISPVAEHEATLEDNLNNHTESSVDQANQTEPMQRPYQFEITGPVFEKDDKTTTSINEISRKFDIPPEKTSEIINSLAELEELAETEGPRLVAKLQKLANFYGENFKNVYSEVRASNTITPNLSFLQKPSLETALKKVSVVGGLSLWSTLAQKESWTKFDEPNLNTLSTGNAALDAASYMVPIAGNIKDFNDARLAWPDRKLEAALSATAGAIGMVMDGISVLGVTAPVAQGAKLGVKIIIRGAILGVRKIGKWMATETAKNVLESLTFKSFRSTLGKTSQGTARNIGGEPAKAH